MNAAPHKFVFDSGWWLTLPSNWACLKQSDDTLPPAGPAVVFTPQEDQSLSLSWVVSGHPIKTSIVEKFAAEVMSPGPRDPLEVRILIQNIFPAIGEITESRVVELPDGSRALELLEIFWAEGSRETGKGYQLVLPFALLPTGPVRFQRLCFYAESKIFSRWIDDVRQIARSYQRGMPE